MMIKSTKVILRYIVAWLIMPIIAVRHKITGVARYEIKTEKLKTIKRYNYITAREAWDTILELHTYGDWIELVEIKKSGKPKVLLSLRW